MSRVPQNLKGKMDIDMNSTSQICNFKMNVLTPPYVLMNISHKLAR